MDKMRKAIGFMSGTSMDGIDVALVETDGEGVVVPIAGETFAYSEEDRAVVAAALDQARTVTDRDIRTGDIGKAEALITQRHSQALGTFLTGAGLGPGDIDIIGFHGQTILHRPEEHLTIQLGDGSRLAADLGIDVVYDFREADVAAGGEGAPFVPIYHKALLEKSEIECPAVVVNVGGVANVTWVGADGALLAFDTGPGNALIDDWMRLKTDETVDVSGALGLSGEANMPTLEMLMENPYFLAPPPKSLDRNAFLLDALDGLSVADGAATLALFTARTIAQSSQFMAEPPKRWIICGGGVKNGAIMQALARECVGEVAPGSAFGWNTDLIEAEAFAYMAVRSLKGLPLTYPGTTGVAAPLTGGRLATALAS